MHESNSNSSQEAGSVTDNVLPPEDQWPAPNEVWLHRKGAEYTVIDVTSPPDPEKAEKFPVTVFYRGPDGRKWPRKLTSWMKSFTRLRAAPAEVDAAALAEHRSARSAGRALAAALEANLSGSQNQVAIKHPIPTPENAGTLMFGLLDSYLAILQQFPEAKVDEPLLAKVRLSLGVTDPHGGEAPGQAS